MIVQQPPVQVRPVGLVVAPPAQARPVEPAVAGPVIAAAACAGASVGPVVAPPTTSRPHFGAPPVSGGQPGTVAPRPLHAPGVAVTGTAQLVLRCSLRTPQAPGGGLATLSGQGFGASLLVRIGGSIAPIIQRGPTEVQVQVPRGSGGGAVAVTSDGQTAQCGQLAIIR